MEAKFKHLEFIQGVINRMGFNSFILKGWTITLVAALFALAQKETNSVSMCLAYFPTVIFWLLDSYYLWQERLFRKLYDKVRLMNESQIDFSMNTSVVAKEAGGMASVIISRTIIPFYGIIILTILFIVYVSTK
jgi:hypothetical protein